MTQLLRIHHDVSYDSRFNLPGGPDSDFLRFLCETVHPVVRPNTEEAKALVESYNNELARDGWRLVAVNEPSGRPIYVAEQSEGRAEIFVEPTGWQKVDRQSQEVRLRLTAAETEEQPQAVGLLCREVLISVAQEAFNPSVHRTVDGVEPSHINAKRMLEAALEYELAGGENEEARGHARAALRLALPLQHRRTADFRMAASCAEATSSVAHAIGGKSRKSSLNILNTLSNNGMSFSGGVGDETISPRDRTSL